ncbi:MAG: hypothetical protein ACOZJX_06710 [Pseudomonadota bacterium]
MNGATRWLATLWVMWVAAVPAHAAARFVDVGHTGSEWFELALHTLEPEGPALQFWTRSYTGGYYNTYRMTKVRVDCQARTRQELFTVLLDRANGTAGRAPSTEMRRVFEKTRQAEELDTACRIVATGQVPDDVREVEPAPAPSALPKGEGRTIGTGWVAARDGLVLTAFEPAQACQKLSVWHRGVLYPAALLNEHPMAHLAVLKVGGDVAGQLVSSQREDLGFASAMVAFDGLVQRWTALKPVAAADGDREQAGLYKRLPLPVPASMSWVLDDEQAVLGLALFDGRDDPQRPFMELVETLPMWLALLYHGGDWPRREASPASPAAASQAGAAETGLVRIACHDQ